MNDKNEQKKKLSKKTILLIVGIVAALVLGLVIWKICGASDAGAVDGNPTPTPTEPADSQNGDAAVQDAAVKTPAQGEETGETQESSEGAQLLETEDGVEIIIPDDEESDGF
jgi:hypothetical protein